MAVSLALRHHPTVSASTIHRVDKIARELGYRPNPLVSALMAQRNRPKESAFQAKIAFLTAFPERDEWRLSAYAAGCYRGAQAAALTRGYVCEPIWLREPGMSASRLSKILWTQGFQGLLVGPLPVNSLKLELEWTRFAAISLDYSIADPVLHRVVDDHAVGIERVLGEILRRGYGRPGLVLRASQDVRTHHGRLGAFMVHRSLQPKWAHVPPLILPEDRWNTEIFSEWLVRERPDVVLTEEMQLPAAVAALGLKVPRDLGIAFFHKDRPARHLSGLQVNSEQVGRIATNVLMRMIETNERGAATVPATTLLSSFTWDAGRTLRRVPAS